MRPFKATVLLSGGSSEAYLGPCVTYTVKLLCENN